MSSGLQELTSFNASFFVVCFLLFFQCAILSPAFKVREFSVTDATPFPISLLWNTEAEDTEG